MARMEPGVSLYSRKASQQASTIDDFVFVGRSKRRTILVLCCAAVRCGVLYVFAAKIKLFLWKRRKQ